MNATLVLFLYAFSYQDSSAKKPKKPKFAVKNQIIDFKRCFNYWSLANIRASSQSFTSFSTHATLLWPNFTWLGNSPFWMKL
jgi:hypothetical protein